MGLVWNAWGLPGVLAMLLAFALAGLVYFSAPVSPASRRMTVVLALEGVVAGTATGLLYLVDGHAQAYGIQAVGVTAFLVLPFVYLGFLATLDTPWVRPLRGRFARGALWLAGLGVLVYWFVEPNEFIPRMAPTRYTAWEAASGPGLSVFVLIGLFVYIFALVASFSAFRHARTEIARRRARAYVLAFGVLDGLRVLLRLSVVAFPPEAGGVGDLRFVLAVPLMILIYVPLLAYGILRTQLFDIDVKIKWTMKQSTVAAIFIGLFFVVSESAAAFFSDRVGTYMGIVAAGLLVFLVAPLQRVAERLSNAALPKVNASPEYFMYKKFEVFRAALESMLQDQVISPKERLMLTRLQERLGISVHDAQSLESDVRAVLGTAPVVAATSA